MKKDTTSLFYVSRNFVEFGGFTASEIVGFYQRGILSGNDYVRSAEDRDWLPIGTYLSSVEPSPEPSAEASAKPTPRKRSSTAAKAPKKAA